MSPFCVVLKGSRQETSFVMPCHAPPGFFARLLVHFGHFYFSPAFCKFYEKMWPIQTATYRSSQGCLPASFAALPLFRLEMCWDACLFRIFFHVLNGEQLDSHMDSLRSARFFPIPCVNGSVSKKLGPGSKFARETCPSLNQHGWLVCFFLGFPPNGGFPFGVPLKPPTQGQPTSKEKSRASHRVPQTGGLGFRGL